MTAMLTGCNSSDSTSSVAPPDASCASGVAFVAMESSGKVATSPDGSCWTYNVAQAFNDGGVARQLVKGGGGYLMIGYNMLSQLNYIKSSTNLTGWGNAYSEGGFTTSFSTIAHDGSTFVMGGRLNGNHIMHSPDGGTWTEAVTPVTPVGHLAAGATDNFIWPGGGKFSVDGGINWTSMTTNVSTLPSACSNGFSSAYGNSTFVTARCGKAYYSTDGGDNWTVTSTTGMTNLLGVAYGNNRFVAVGFGSGSGEIWVSSDFGITWIDVTPSDSSDSIDNVTYGSGTFVAGGRGFVYTSTDDGQTWTKTAHPSASTRFVDIISAQ